MPTIGQNYLEAIWEDILKSVGPRNTNQRGVRQRMDLFANKQITGKNSIFYSEKCISKAFKTEILSVLHTFPIFKELALALHWKDEI